MTLILQIRCIKVLRISWSLFHGVGSFGPLIPAPIAIMYHTTSLPNLGFLSLLSFAWVAAGLSPNVSVPGVTTSAGTIQGTLCNTTSARAYLSIPYAQAPVDGLRWLPPQPYNQSYPGGTYYATNKAPNCVQFGREYLESGPSSEDW